MGYVAIKGGGRAIREAEAQLDVLRTQGAAEGEMPLQLDQISHQLHFLNSQVMSEGGLYDPELAALALKQSLGDPLEASFHLRAFRSTRPRIATAPVADTSKMRVIRRISSAFKEIPGGQRLGPTPDYTHRLLDFELMDETPQAFRALFDKWRIDLEPESNLDTLPKVINFLREQGLVERNPPCEEKPHDISREPIVFPLSRSAALSLLTRGHRGSLLALAYSNMRGYGSVHPTVAELRVGYLPIEMPHPATGEPIEVGEILMTECELLTGISASGAGSAPKLSLGYAACYGHDELKCICMAILDRAIQNGKRSGGGLKNPSEDEEFVLLHIDGIDSMGFCIHYKLPHYVTFQAGLDRIRETNTGKASANTAPANGTAAGNGANGTALNGTHPAPTAKVAEEKVTA